MCKVYESIEDVLTHKICNDSVFNIEKFLGYPISADILENLEDRIRNILDNMSEDEMIQWELKYLSE